MFGFFNKFSHDMGIDLGTANTLVHVKGKGIIIREPSVVAVDKANNEVLAIGAEAKQMIGRTPGHIIAIRPMKDGVIADFDITQSMLKFFIKKAIGKNSLVRPRIVVGVPSGVTEVEKRAVIDATVQAGAREAYLIEEPMAAAIGAGLPVQEATGSMVVDINQVCEALNEPVTNILDAVRNTLERTPPELAADIMDRGVVMTGGSSLLRNLDRIMSRDTGMPVYVSDDALSCVALGTGLAVENVDVYKKGFMASNSTN